MRLIETSSGLEVFGKNAAMKLMLAKSGFQPKKYSPSRKTVLVAPAKVFKMPQKTAMEIMNEQAK